jgi:hypothetical protein
MKSSGLKHKSEVENTCLSQNPKHVKINCKTTTAKVKAVAARGYHVLHVPSASRSPPTQWDMTGRETASARWFIPFSLALTQLSTHVAMCSSKCLTCKIERARVKVRRQSVHSTKHACRRECERNKRTHDVQCATQATAWTIFFGQRSDESFLIRAGPFFQAVFVNEWTHFWHCAE